MPIHEQALIDFLSWCHKKDPDGLMSYKIAARLYNMEKAKMRAKLEITLSPTEEIYNAPINDVLVPARVWKGKTAGGVPIEAYVLSIVPDGDVGSEFEAEVMPHLKRSRDTFKVNIGEGRSERIDDMSGSFDPERE